MSNKLPNCFKCVHHFITYSRSRPYGCRAMKFKSKISPSRVVYESSGIICQLYTPKDETTPPDKNGKNKKWIV